jgi:hypothetical protein
VAGLVAAPADEGATLLAVLVASRAHRGHHGTQLHGHRLRVGGGASRRRGVVVGAGPAELVGEAVAEAPPDVDGAVDVGGNLHGAVEGLGRGGVHHDADLGLEAGDELEDQVLLSGGVAQREGNGVEGVSVVLDGPALPQVLQLVASLLLLVDGGKTLQELVAEGVVGLKVVLVHAPPAPCCAIQEARRQQHDVAIMGVEGVVQQAHVLVEGVEEITRVVRLAVELAGFGDVLGVDGPALRGSRLLGRGSSTDHLGVDGLRDGAVDVVANQLLLLVGHGRSDDVRSDGGRGLFDGTHDDARGGRRNDRARSEDGSADHV